MSAPDTSSHTRPVVAGQDREREHGAPRHGDPVLVATALVESMGAEALRVELFERIELTLDLLSSRHELPPRFDMVARELRAAADLAETDPELALRRLIARTREQLLAGCTDCEGAAA